MKKIYLLNPGAADELRIREHLINSLKNFEFESLIAKDISKIAKRSIYIGSVCDLTEVFNSLSIQNERFKETVLKRAFEIIEETEKNMYLKLK